MALGQRRRQIRLRHRRSVWEGRGCSAGRGVGKHRNPTTEDVNVFKYLHVSINVVLELEPLDGSFDPKVIHLPVFPKFLLVGRQISSRRLRQVRTVTSIQQLFLEDMLYCGRHIWQSLDLR